MLLLSIFFVLVFSFTYIYAGIAFWRTHKDTFLRLSVYDLTQQSGLIENFGESSVKNLAALNRIALDALSFNRLLKLFLGWPMYQFTYHRALSFAAYSSKLLGDEQTEKLKYELINQGFPQADRDDRKRAEQYTEGFLIRRLDEELISIFWHVPQASFGSASLPEKVLLFKVPTQVRLQRLQAFISKREGSTYWAQGANQKSTPYIVVFEPYSFGKAFRLKDVWVQAQSDFKVLKSRLSGHVHFAKIKTLTSEVCEEGKKMDFRAEKAFARFLRSAAPKSSPGKLPS